MIEVSDDVAALARLVRAPRRLASLRSRRAMANKITYGLERERECCTSVARAGRARAGTRKARGLAAARRARVGPCVVLWPHALRRAPLA